MTGYMNRHVACRDRYMMGGQWACSACPTHHALACSNACRSKMKQDPALTCGRLLACALACLAGALPCQLLPDAGSMQLAIAALQRFTCLGVEASETGSCVVAIAGMLSDINMLQQARCARMAIVCHRRKCAQVQCSADPAGSSGEGVPSGSGHVRAREVAGKAAARGTVANTAVPAHPVIHACRLAYCL